MIVSSDDAERMKRNHPVALTWMYINLAAYLTIILFNLWKTTSLSIRSFRCSKVLDLLIAVLQIAFGVWGCVLYFGEEYGRSVELFEDK